METEIEEIVSLWKDLRVEMIRLADAALDLKAWLVAEEAKARPEQR